jgi:hypothetical protein
MQLNLLRLLHAQNLKRSLYDSIQMSNTGLSSVMASEKRLLTLFKLDPVLTGM